MVIDGNLIFVENSYAAFYPQKCFGRHAPEGVYWYYQGRLSQVLLEWACQQTISGDIFHAPDYDLVGLDEYLRYKEHFGDRVSLLVPPQLEKLLKKHGLKRGLESGRPRRRIESSNDPEVLSLYQLLRDNEGTFQQEGFLLLDTPEATNE